MVWRNLLIIYSEQILFDGIIYEKETTQHVALADKFRDMFDKLLQKGFTTDQAFGYCWLLQKTTNFKNEDVRYNNR